MAREKIVVVTLDEDGTVLPTHPAFDKVEREGERGLAISYNKDRMNAGEVLAAVNAMGHGIVDVSTREADLEDVFLNLTRAAAQSGYPFSPFGMSLSNPRPSFSARAIRAFDKLRQTGKEGGRWA